MQSNSLSGIFDSTRRACTYEAVSSSTEIVSSSLKQNVPEKKKKKIQKDA